MSQFLDIVKENVISSVMELPFKDATEKLVTIHCNKAFKNKLENEITNSYIRYRRQSNHSEIPAMFQLCGINVTLDVKAWNIKPKYKAEHYDKRD